MQNDKISIIIPVYNAEKTIERCLKSVCEQSYKNLEIIVVNDGSSDSTKDILEEWQKKDSRIKVIHQENQGAASARNNGLDHMQGKYFGFIDADDIVELLIYEKLYNAAIEKKSDIVSASIREIYNGDIVEERINSDDLPELTGEEAAINLLKYEGGIRTVVWDKLYRTDVFRTLRFEKGYIFGEDTLFNFKAMGMCKKYIRIPYIGYTYDHRMSSVTGHKYSHAKMSNIYVIEQIKEEYDKKRNELVKKEEMLNAINQFSVTMYRQIFHQLLLEGDYRSKDKKDYEKLKKAAMMVDGKFVKEYLNFKEYIQWKMYLYCPLLFKFANRLHHFGNRR